MEQWAVDPHMEMAKRGWSMVKEPPGEDYEDVSGCKGIWKKVLEPGNPAKVHKGKPLEGSFTDIEYWYRYKGLVVDSTEKDGALEIIPGSGMSTAGMEEGVATMHVGERATFTLDPLFAFKENGLPPHVPEWATVELEIHLVDFMGPWSPQGRIDCATEFKQEGNAFFKEGEYRSALRKYNKGLDVVGRRRRAVPRSEQEWDEGQHLVRVALLQNVMQCWLRLENMDRCLEFADNILRQDPNNVKARFRRAKFETSKHNYHTANEHLEAIKGSCTDEAVLKEVRGELKRIETIRRKNAEREKETAKRAALALGGGGGGGGGDGDDATKEEEEVVVASASAAEAAKGEEEKVAVESSQPILPSTAVEV